MVSALLLVPLLLGAERVITAGAVHAELTGRAALAPALGLYPELRVQPMLAVDYGTGALHLGVGYSPIVTAELGRATVLHVAAGTAEWSVTRRLRTRFNARANVGQFDTSMALAVGELTDPTRIVPKTTIDYLQTSASLGMDLEPTPRLRLLGDVGYRVNGGLTAAARNVIPMSHGPQLNLGATDTPSGRESYGGRLELGSEQFSNGRTTMIARGLATWTRKLLRDAQLHVAGGAAAVQSWDQTTANAGAMPVGQVGLVLGRPELNLSVDAQVTPLADALTGNVYEQAGGSSQVEWRPRSDMVVRARGGASWSVAGANAGDRAILGEASASYRDHKNEVSFGVRLADFELASATNPHLLEVRAFLGLTLVGARVH